MTANGMVYFVGDKVGWYNKDGDLIREVTLEEATKLLQGQDLI